ncbi:MAG: NADH-quinone oxidoreductase subunit A [Candidatus Nezhaarchaeota archaeon]|nr:NADH-quinone oxidoreductase subunit A [Candidatus Nezhaarchaeota archaeon]
MVSEATLQGVSLALYVLMSFVFCISSILFAKILSPSRPNPRKTLTYECGQVPAGPTKSRFTVQYYPYAVVYAIYGALAIVLLLSAPGIQAMSPAQLWIVLLILASFTFSLMGALVTLKPLIRPKRR